MTAPLATVRSYDELQAALRARAMALRLVLDGRCRHSDRAGRDRSLDGVAGLPMGYAAKLLAPIPVKAIGRSSLGPLLAALGCALVLVEDADLLARITSRIERDPHRNGSASENMLAKRRAKKRGFHNKRRLRGASEFGRLLNARRQLLVPKSARSAIARKAAKARWARPKTAPPIEASGK